MWTDSSRGLNFQREMVVQFLERGKEMLAHFENNEVRKGGREGWREEEREGRSEGRKEGRKEGGREGGRE
jgi:hypothetical protein